MRFLAAVDIERFWIPQSVPLQTVEGNNRPGR